MAGRCGHSLPVSHRFTTLRLIYWFYLLLAPQPTLAETPQDPSRSDAVTLESTNQTPVSTPGVNDDTRTAMNRTSQMAWALGILPSNTCKFNCGGITKGCCMVSCNCDKVCRLYKDCCPDFEEECPLEAAESLTGAYMQNMSHLASYISRDWIAAKNGYSAIKEIMWIRTCPEEVDHTLKEQCEGTFPISRSNLALHLPVVQNGFIFRNKFCALCHRTTGAKTIISFEIRCMRRNIQYQIYRAVQFNDVDGAFELIQANECGISHNIKKIPRNALRFVSTTSTGIKSGCPGTESVTSTGGPPLEPASLCQMYQARVFLKGSIIYNNPHCALCNGALNPDDYSVSSTCFSPDCGLDSSVKSFAILVDTAQSGDVDIDRVFTSYGCPMGHIYDELRYTCQDVPCPVGFIRKGDICSEEYKLVPQALKAGHDIYTIAFLGILFPADYLKAYPFLIDKLRADALVLNLYFVGYDFQCSSLPRDGLGEHFQASGCFIVKFYPHNELKISPLTFRHIKNVRNHIQRIYQSFVILVTYLYNYDISTKPKCTTGQEIITRDVVIYDAGYSERVFVSNIGYTLDISRIPVTVFESHGGDNASYQISAKVCVSSKEVEEDMYYKVSTMELVTLIGNVVSLFALLLGMISLSLAPGIKVIIRTLLINLIIALFVAQSTFLIQGFFGTNQWACKIVAIFQHYAWLTYFFMMNSVAIEMAWAFNSLKALVHTQAETSYKGRLAGLLIHGWMSPFLLITPCVILDQVNGHGLNPHYGKNTSCWLNNSKALLYFFVIPFCIIIGANIILILSAIITIRRNAAPANSSSQERTYLHINIKLSTLMGLSWILGLVASYTKEDALWYIFIVLNTLQGVILFCAFASPHHAIQYIRSRLSTRTTG